MPDVFVAPKKKKNKTKKARHVGKTISKTSVAKKINNKKKNTKKENIQSKDLKHFHKPPFTNILEKEKSIDPNVHLKRPLAAFSFHPDGIDFETRESEEKVILFLRQHPIVNIPWILITTLMIIAPSFVTNFELLQSIPPNFKFVFLLLWYLITIAYSYEKFLTWFFNVYIVTDERIVDIDFYNLIYKEVSDAKIDRIQDVTYNMGGVVRTLFNYGNVYIQTASEVPNFEFMAVPKPDKVVRVLQDMQMEEEQEKIEGRVR